MSIMWKCDDCGKIFDMLIETWHFCPKCHGQIIWDDMESVW